MEKPSDKFRRWRESRSWSQKDVADALGVSQTLVSQLERGATVVTKIDVAKRIRDAMRGWEEGPIEIEDWATETTVAEHAIAEQGR